VNSCAHEVLVVDDLNFFQMRLKEIISENLGLSVFGAVATDREADINGKA